jgi:pyrroline-5-carboxylate reductase
MSEFKLEHDYKVGILACGTMGTAVLNAIVEGVSDRQRSSDSGPIPDSFCAAVNSRSSADRLQKLYGDKVQIIVGDNASLVAQSDVIVLGCKPYMASKILGDIDAEKFKNKVVISLLAGKTIDELFELTGRNAIVVRAMTNTPSKIGAGMTVVSLPANATDSVRSAIEWIFNRTGRCLFLDEKLQDVSAALCGSGPAFLYLVMEALCDGAVRMGMPYNIAQECAAQVLVGAGQMVLEGGHPAVLRNSVCTPGGTTIGGLLVMEDNKVRSAVARAVEEATNIATKLGQKK